MKTYGILLVLLLLGATSVQAQAEPDDVTLKAPDGLELQATFYAGAEPGPGILLFHQCNRDRTTWAELATMLAAEGLHVLTLDYRGYGESGGERFQELPREQRPAEVAKWPADIDVAFAWLRDQPGIDKERIGAAGASCGVNQSIQLARRHPEVKSLALLSGTTDEAGRRHLQQTAGLPVLAAASRDDGNAVQDMQWILGFSRNPENRFVEYEAAGHGTDMFAVEAGLQPLLVEWFAATLRDVDTASATEAEAPSEPSPIEEFWDVLTEPGGASRARELFAEAKTRDPDVFLFPEFAVNLFGYERLQAGAAEEAIEIMKLNVDAYPESANVYDSLADAYAAAGQTEKAIELSEKALEILHSHPPEAEGLAEGIRESAERKLRELRGEGRPEAVE